MRRREFMRLLGGAAVAWPIAVSAQQMDRMRRVGVLMGYAEGDPQAQATVTALRQGLHDLQGVELVVSSSRRWFNGHSLSDSGNASGARNDMRDARPRPTTTRLPKPT